MTAKAIDRDETLKDFGKAVNMTAGELERYLETEESQKVGWKGAGGHEENVESIGHMEGRRIVELLRKPRAELSDDDLHHMRRVVGYVHRHLAEGGPAEDKEGSRWRYSLMNWGHDPLK